MSARRIDEIRESTARGLIGRWPYRRLAETLQTRDDTPEALKAAADCLEHAFSAIVSPPRAGRVGTGVDAGIDRSTPDFSSRVLAVLRAFAPWLGAEGRVLRRIGAADAGESVPRLSLIPWSSQKATRPSAEAYRRLLEPSGAGPGPCSVDPGNEVEPVGRAVATMLALSCFPGRRLGELFGFALAEACPANGLLFDLAAVIADGPLRGSFDDYLAARELAAAPRRLALRSAIGLHLSEQAGERMAPATSAIQRGVALYRHLTDELRGALAAMLGRPRQAPADALAAILGEKARFAQGYHHAVMVGDIRLDDWFAAHQSPADLLGALARSKWVDRDVPERSRLLGLFDFGGPMFGVFDAAEREILVAWLHSLVEPAGNGSGFELGSSAVADDRSGHPQSQATVPCLLVDGRSPRGPVYVPKHGPSSLGVRGTFHRLLGIECERDVLESAANLVTRWLRGTARDIRQWSSRFTFTPERFDAWLASRYRPPAAVAAPARPRLPRQAYVFAIEQMAPAVLVDGCWLQRAAELSEGSPEVAERLARIHRDELGDGYAERSHPVIYRDLLRSVGLELPAITDTAFAEHPRFVDAAFDLPVYMLGLSLAPRRWLPEILGLNLAIELSGLGAGYQRTARELEFWGIDPLIVRLHQSIDTLAGGHAALAREAILLHLGQVRALGGDASVQQHWRRIWLGYHSLRTVTRRFRRQLIVSYLWRSVTG